MDPVTRSWASNLFMSIGTGLMVSGLFGILTGEVDVKNLEPTIWSIVMLLLSFVVSGFSYYVATGDDD